MKKAILLALATLCTVATPALAHPPAPANVNFSSERGVPFGLVLDGRPLTRGVARQVRVDRLAPGLHWADFSVPTPYGGAVRYRSRVWLEPGLETSFVLLARPGRPLALRQVGAVALYGPRGSYGYPGRGNGYGGAYNYPQPYGPGTAYPAPQGGYYSAPGNDPASGTGGYDDDHDDEGYDANDRGPDGYPADEAGYPNDRGAGGYPNEGRPGSAAPNSPRGGSYYPGPATGSYRRLSATEAAGLLQAVQREGFDDRRLRVARQGLAQSALSSQELKRLLQALSFEPARVELATFGYAHLTDPQQFEQALDALQFEASRQRVLEAIADAPQPGR